MNLACALCGIEGPQVRPRLVQWADSKEYDSIPACTDHDECRARVLALGEDWPLVPSKEAA